MAMGRRMRRWVGGGTISSCRTRKLWDDAGHWGRQLRVGGRNDRNQRSRGNLIDNGGLHAHAALVTMTQEPADVVAGAWFRQSDDIVPGFVFSDWVQAVASFVVRLVYFLNVVCYR